MLFTDADSLVYEINKNDVYEDFYKNKELLFNFIDYTEDSKFFDLINKKVFCKTEHEFERKIISEFVGLKSKMYSLVVLDGEKVKKAK